MSDVFKNINEKLKNGLNKEEYKEVSSLLIGILNPYLMNSMKKDEIYDLWIDKIDVVSNYINSVDSIDIFLDKGIVFSKEGEFIKKSNFDFDQYINKFLKKEFKNYPVYKLYFSNKNNIEILAILNHIQS